MISKSFFNKSTLEVARNLLGYKLINESTEGVVEGIIVETEAYLRDDPASHSFKGIKKRNMAMFDEAGTAYVYFTYGMYYCFNVVTNKKGIGEAVLIRALEPTRGIDIMKRRRKTDEIKNLCSGPGKLVIAMEITKENNHQSLLSGRLRLEKGIKVKSSEIVETKRIGISKGVELPHRFYIKGNEFISRH